MIVISDTSAITNWATIGSNLENHASAREVMSHATVLNFKELVVEQTILLRQRFKIKTPDAIIAATALA
ncbi:hypothetical protein [Phormidium sp. FACHB-1136]|uniref:hypothetical protein n=1 Tax=Phormidium sp. FACHB-1136 TaxID=2692848 RepID=UPI001688156E|nr:hypothetical protein [Phormidium sp. FACHB-1136]MBD2426361.1 hypothetical protein [Phormidium sp. FACHB-1136]